MCKVAHSNNVMKYFPLSAPAQGIFYLNSRNTPFRW